MRAAATDVYVVWSICVYVYHDRDSCKKVANYQDAIWEGGVRLSWAQQTIYYASLTCKIKFKKNKINAPKVCNNFCNLLALAYCCSQSRWRNAGSYIFITWRHELRHTCIKLTSAKLASKSNKNSRWSQVFNACYPFGGPTWSSKMDTVH